MTETIISLTILALIFLKIVKVLVLTIEYYINLSNKLS